jgi:hypothetical protein
VSIGPQELCSFVTCVTAHRCGDSAPTVRVRAVNALSTMLESFSVQTEGQVTATQDAGKCNLFLGLVLGTEGPALLRLERLCPQTPSFSSPFSPDAQSTVCDDVKTYNILESLRARVHDDKPIVRSRAVTAFGLALRLRYPKFTQAFMPFESMDSSDHDVTDTLTAISNGKLQLEYVSMFVMEDDVSLLVELCDDTSISVRKCAIAALTNLARAKSSDASILDSWVSRHMFVSSRANTLK